MKHITSRIEKLERQRDKLIDRRAQSCLQIDMQIKHISDTISTLGQKNESRNERNRRIFDTYLQSDYNVSRTARSLGISLQSAREAVFHAERELPLNFRLSCRFNNETMTRDVGAVNIDHLNFLLKKMFVKGVKIEKITEL